MGVAYAQDTLRVRVMTYNLRFGELASLEELAHHIKSFKPDFVALQEVDSKTDRKRTPHQKGKDFISELAYHTGMFGLYGTLYAKYRSSREEEVNAFAGSAWQMLFASVMFWICAVVNGDVREADLSTVSVTSWFSLLYLISFGSLLAYSAYVWLLKVRPAAEVGTHAYVNPFIAVLLGVSFGNEQVTFVQLSGLLVILLGVMLISRKRNKMKSTAISR